MEKKVNRYLKISKTYASEVNQKILTQEEIGDEKKRK